MKEEQENELQSMIWDTAGYNLVPGSRFQQIMIKKEISIICYFMHRSLILKLQISFLDHGLDYICVYT